MNGARPALVASVPAAKALEWGYRRHLFFALRQKKFELPNFEGRGIVNGIDITNTLFPAMTLNAFNDHHP
jgi:hypothetical protein